MLIIVIEEICLIQNTKFLLELDGFCHRYDYLNIKGNITEVMFLLGEKPAPML